jgi:hypothetical protein
VIATLWLLPPARRSPRDRDRHVRRSSAVVRHNELPIRAVAAGAQMKFGGPPLPGIRGIKSVAIDP